MEVVLTMNVPNALTILRLILIPIFVLVFFSRGDNSLVYAICIFLAAGFTDILDGYIARKFNLITKIGTVLDPLADKLMLLTVLTCLLLGGYIPYWILTIVLFKEVFMIASGIILFNKDYIEPSNLYGKASTFLFYIAIFLIVINPHIGNYFLYLAVGSALIALLSYIKSYIKHESHV